MLEARKENKVYKINESQKTRYLNEGFDIYNGGKIIEHTPKKLIKYSDHIKAMDELKGSLKQPKGVTELLKGYAEGKGIELGSSTSAKGILDKILEAEKLAEQE